MKSLAVLKRVLLAAAGAIATLSIARPAAAAPFYFYTITAVPQWGVFGNPEAVKSWLALTALNGSVLTTPFAAEDYVSLGLQGYNGVWYTYDTFLGESKGFIGADVSIPTAQWLAPAAYVWAGGPAGGGGLAFFNSFNPFTGIFYANELIVLDPPGCDASCDLSLLEAALGSSSGTLTPSTVTLDANGDPVGIPMPTDDEDASVAPNPNGANYFASGSMAPTPEGPTAIYVLIGMAAGAGVFFRPGRRILPAA